MLLCFGRPIQTIQTALMTLNTIKRPKSVNLAEMTAVYCNYLISSHVKAISTIHFDGNIFLSPSDIPEPNSASMQALGIYLSCAANGATINSSNSQRRNQRFIVQIWSRNRNRGELGAQIVTAALAKKAHNIVESTITLNPETGVYSGTVSGYISTRVQGHELAY